MRKLLFIIALISNTFYVFSQPSATEKKSRQIIVTSPDSVIYAVISTSKKDYKKPDNTKIYFWFSMNEIHSNKGGYSGSLLDGSYEVFNTAGNLIRKGYMNDGLPNNTWNYWNNEGQLIKTEEWNDGIMKEVFIYNSRGKLIRSSDMQKKEEKEKLTKTKKQEKEKKSESKRIEKEKRKDDASLKRQSKKQENVQSEVPPIPEPDKPESKFKTAIKKFFSKVGTISLKKDKSQQRNKKNV